MTRNVEVFRRCAIAGFFMSLGFIALWPSLAGAMSVTVNPTRASVSLETPQVNLSWTVLGNINSLDGACVNASKNDFRSPSGEVLGNAPVPPFDGAPKSGCIIGYSPQTRTEVLTVPEAVLGAAFARGLPYIVLRRTWLNFIKLDGNISVNFPGPDVTIDIIYKPATPSTPPISGTPTTPSTPATSGTIGAELSVSRLFLRFEDGSLVRLLPSGGRLRGVAEID